MTQRQPSKMLLFWRNLLHKQHKWIETCEAGRSYLGPNGTKIRQADENELRRIQTNLNEMEGRHAHR